MISRRNFLGAGAAAALQRLLPVPPAADLITISDHVVIESSLSAPPLWAVKTPDEINADLRAMLETIWRQESRA